MGNDDIVRVSCAHENCGTFPMDGALNRRLRKSGDTFTCPAGHRQHFNPESDDRKRKQEIKRLKERLENYREEAGRLWDELRDERAIRKELEAELLADVDGVIELGDGRYKWACECGNKTTTTYDTEREAWDAYDGHRGRLHDEAAATA